MTNIYARDVSHIKTLDPYRLQELYKMHPCAEHVVKKLLVAGEREGGKSLDTDISDCIRTLQRWQAMREEDSATDEWPSWATHSLLAVEGGSRHYVKRSGAGYVEFVNGCAHDRAYFNANSFVAGSLERRP